MAQPMSQIHFQNKTSLLRDNFCILFAIGVICRLIFTCTPEQCCTYKN